MRRPAFQLKMSRPGDVTGDPITWVAASQGDVIHVTLPDGAAVQVPRDEDALVTLQTLAAAVPGINSVPMRQRLEIECSPSVAAVLPLWLRALDEEGAGTEETDDSFADVEEQISWATCNPDHYVFVNGWQWAAISASSAVPETSWAVVPVRGNWFTEWFDQGYASFGFTETASMTSGWDSSVCGLITPRVFAVVDRFDEGGTYVWIRSATDPTSDLREWIWRSELAEQLRQTWEIPDDDDDFIEWGFLQLTKEGKNEIEVRGLDPSLDDTLGVGLTTTSHWTFTRTLPSDEIRKALGKMADRRPGGVAVKQPRIFAGSFQEQLEEAALLSDDELIDEGWVPTVEVDREVGIKIFNARVEPEIEPQSAIEGWPASWDARITPLWLRLGGTVEAARAWAEAGWDFSDVLRNPRLSRYWNPPMAERLRATAIPALDTLDMPATGSQAWPAGDHTISEVLTVFRDTGGW